MYETELYHHGIKGQKWGVRRFQDYNGRSLVGAQHYKRSQKIHDKLVKAADKRLAAYSSGDKKKIAAAEKRYKRLGEAYEKADDADTARRNKHAAKDYKRALNELDKGIAEETRDYSDAMRSSRENRDVATKYKDKADIATEKGKTARAEKLMAKSNKYAGIADSFKKTADEHAKNISKGYDLTEKYIKKAQSEGLTVSSKRTSRNVTRGSEWVLNAASYMASAYTGIAIMETHHVEGRKYNVRRPKER